MHKHGGIIAKSYSPQVGIQGQNVDSSGGVALLANPLKDTSNSISILAERKRHSSLVPYERLFAHLLVYRDGPSISDGKIEL
jgi:hypothetical protein